MLPGGSICIACATRSLFRGLELYLTGRAQHLMTAGKDLDGLDYLSVDLDYLSVDICSR